MGRKVITKAVPIDLLCVKFDLTDHKKNVKKILYHAIRKEITNRERLFKKKIKHLSKIVSKFEQKNMYVKIQVLVLFQDKVQTKPEIPHDSGSDYLSLKA